jgi:hypothetical protein
MLVSWLLPPVLHVLPAFASQLRGCCTDHHTRGVVHNGQLYKATAIEYINGTARSLSGGCNRSRWAGKRRAIMDTLRYRKTLG